MGGARRHAAARRPAVSKKSHSNDEPTSNSKGREASKRPKTRIPDKQIAEKKLMRIQKEHDEISIALDELGFLLQQFQPDDNHSRQQMRRANSVLVTKDLDGSSKVAVDGMAPFSIPPVLAVLTQILASETGTGGWSREDDPCVPYKTVKEILERMEKILGRPYSDGALKQAVYRMRKLMEPQACDLLVQTMRLCRGYRIAVRRRVEPALSAAF